MTIDKEWENFISSKYNDDISSEEDEEDANEIIQQTSEEFISANLNYDLTSEAPKPSTIYISTKTKIAYLNTPIDLKQIFWEIPVIPYAKPINGVKTSCDKGHVLIHTKDLPKYSYLQLLNQLCGGILVITHY